EIPTPQVGAASQRAAADPTSHGKAERWPVAPSNASAGKATRRTRAGAHPAACAGTPGSSAPRPMATAGAGSTTSAATPPRPWHDRHSTRRSGARATTQTAPVQTTQAIRALALGASADAQPAAGPLARPPANQQGTPAANHRPLPPTAPASPPRPYLGPFHVSSSGRLPLQQLDDQLTQHGRKDGKLGGLGPRTIRQVHLCLHQALGYAMKWHDLPANPAADAEPPAVPA